MSRGLSAPARSGNFSVRLTRWGARARIARVTSWCVSHAGRSRPHAERARKSANDDVATARATTAMVVATLLAPGTRQFSRWVGLVADPSRAPNGSLTSRNESTNHSALTIVLTFTMSTRPRELCLTRGHYEHDRIRHLVRRAQTRRARTRRAYELVTNPLNIRNAGIFLDAMTGTSRRANECIGLAAFVKVTSSCRPDGNSAAVARDQTESPLRELRAQAMRLPIMSRCPSAVRRPNSRIPQGSSRTCFVTSAPLEQIRS
jgi:hypothetical protein